MPPGYIPLTVEATMESSAQIGRSILIKGQIIAQEDVIIAGRVEGTICMNGHAVTIEEGGHVTADIAARDIVVSGSVQGKLIAQDRIELRATADIVGELKAPRVGIADGAGFKGKVVMEPRKVERLRVAS